MSEIAEQVLSGAIKKDDQVQKAEDLKGEHLYSLLIKLRAQSPGELPRYAGQMTHAALLHWIKAVDPECATLLHEPNKRRPFTCSSLILPTDPDSASLQGSHHRVTILPQRIYWLRLTLLTEQMFQIFIHRFFHQTAHLSEKQDSGLTFPLLTLGDIPFDVVDITSEALEGTQGSLSYWSRYTTYAQLVTDACTLDLRQARNCQIGLAFCSPTTFSNGRYAGGKLFWLFPDPDRVFDSLARSWNYWCPPHFVLDLSSLQAYIRERVNVASYHIETRGIQLDCGLQPGFVGQCFYTLLERPRHQMEHGETRSTPGQALHLLSRYALYAGVGQKTAMGMGQARPLA